MNIDEMTYRDIHAAMTDLAQKNGCQTKADMELFYIAILSFSVTSLVEIGDIRKALHALQAAAIEITSTRWANAGKPGPQEDSWSH